ncbi:MAG: hypothetical protein EBX78_03990, partial [Gammaproteobacteria bacterium]|nr:hypothetical protein [Gammaproteobacteria bacterium]
RHRVCVTAEAAVEGHQLLVQHGVLPAGAVESFAPSAEEVQSRLTEHRNLIEAVVRDLQHR